jgi:hypothetical protein
LGSSHPLNTTFRGNTGAETASIYLWKILHYWETEVDCFSIIALKIKHWKTEVDCFAVYRFEEWKTIYWNTEVDLVSCFDLWIENQILKSGSELFFCLLPYWRLKNEMLKIVSFFIFCFVKLKMKIELTVDTVIDLPN